MGPEVVLFLISLLWCNTISSPVPKEDADSSIFLIDIKLNENSTDFVIDVLDKKIDQSVVTSEDIISLFKLNQLTYSEIQNTPITMYDILKSFDRMLISLNIRFNNFIEDAGKTISLTPGDVVEALEVFNVSSKLTKHILNNNHEEGFRTLNEGVYNDKNFQTFCDNIKSTKDSVFENLRNVYLNLFKNIIDMQPIISTWKMSFKQLSTLHPVTIADVNNVPNTKKILDNLEDQIKPFKSSNAIAITTDTMTINKNSYESWKNITSYIDINLSNAEDSITNFSFETVDKNYVAVIVSKNISKPRPLGQSFNETNNCTYTYITPDPFKVTSVEVEDASLSGSRITSDVPDDTPLVIGGALICEGKLFGIAREKVNTTLIFDAVYDGAVIDNGDQDDTGSASINCVSLFVVLISMLLTYMFN
ncbi:uncharacterized protein LOC126264663 [Aethina tumida]|uniref:uncharacterized protein LOC126264663 n=1 Tax=Aethina tumida TaxID=116153 RepID=UPI002148AB98|nr:uncharacterized protein LOC126264663 [Aethina tumida]